MQRILSGGGTPGPPLLLDASTLLDDVLGHLRELFNVRQGSVPTRPDYGMPDINGLVHRFPDAIGILRREITRQIASFEPRLRDVSVRHVPAPDRPLILIFAISGTLLAPGREQRVTVETQLGEDGLLHVRP